MLTFQPLPDWQDLFAKESLERTSPESLSTHWQVANEKCFWYSRAAFALAAIEAWWRRAIEDRPATVWLPDYFCNQSTLPVRQAGAELVFYPVKEDLSPDWLRCRELSTTRTPDLFVLVHYFGIEADGGGAAQFCRESGALLIEDAAHVLRPHGKIGHHGDFIFYSPHKMLPVPDGAILLVNATDRTPNLDRLEHPTASAGCRHTNWKIRRGAQKILPDFLMRRRNRVLPEFDTDPSMRDTGMDLGPSVLSLRILARQLPQGAEIATFRKNNAWALRNLIGAETPDLRPYLDSSREGDAPYRFIIKCEGPGGAKAVYDRLRAQGLPVESWPDLPDEVKTGPEHHSIARKLRDRLVFLPVHQSLSAHDISTIKLID